MAAAKHRGIDQLRRRKMLDRKHLALAYEIDTDQQDAVAAVDDSLDDDDLDDDDLDDDDIDVDVDEEK